MIKIRQFLGVIVVVCAVLAVGCGDAVRVDDGTLPSRGSEWDDDEARIIMLFNGEEIPVAEFEFFLWFHRNHIEAQFGSGDIWEGSPNDFSEFVKEMALNELEDVLSIIAFAREYNVVLPPELQAQAREAAEEYAEMRRAVRGGEGAVSVERLAEFFALPLLLDALAEQLGADVYVSRAEFDEMYAGFIENNAFEYNDILISFFITYHFQEAADFLQELERGGDFHEMLREFAVAASYYGDEHEHIFEPELLLDFHRFFEFDETDLRAIAALEVGEFSHVMGNVWDEWTIVFIEEITEPDFDELAQEQWEGFVNTRRQQYVLAERFVEFAEGFEINLNQRAFDAVRVIDL